MSTVGADKEVKEAPLKQVPRNPPNKLGPSPQRGKISNTAIKSGDATGTDLAVYLPL